MSTHESMSFESETVATYTLSEARHSFNEFPKRFEAQAEPVLITHHGEPVMALLGVEVFTLLTLAVQFLQHKGLHDEFMTWAETTTEEAAAEIQ